jgi:hypothetical protein
MIDYDLSVEPQPNPASLEPPKKRQKNPTQLPNVILNDDKDELPPITSEVTNREKMFLEPAATTTTTLQQPKKLAELPKPNENDS